MSKPKTVKQFVDKLNTALACSTFYKNQYPYNLGYYHSNGKFSFDCVNLVKAILNGWEKTCKVGYFQNTLNETGDCTELGLINQCTGVSADFKKLKKVSVLYMNGHIGTYVGEFTMGGKTFNVIECTSNRWGDGVIATYVNEKGERIACKGSSDKCGTWARHGLLTKWLKYEEEKPFDYKLALRIAYKIEKGDWGNNPERKKKIINKYGEKYYTVAQSVINHLHKY